MNERPIQPSEIKPGMRIHATWKSDSYGNPAFEIIDTVVSSNDTRIAFTECSVSAAATFHQIIAPLKDGIYCVIDINGRERLRQKKEGVWQASNGKAIPADSWTHRYYEEHATLIPTYDPDTHIVISKMRGRIWADQLQIAGYVANAADLRAQCGADPVSR